MRKQATQNPDDGRKSFEEFLLKEYDNIAQAHFNTVETISTFFKHYLLIVSLPLPLVALILKPWGEESAAWASTALREYGFLVPMATFAVACVGFCVMNYVVNLRLDALLYARTVNGIRQHFWTTSGVRFQDELHVGVLPRSPHRPRYLE